MSLFNAGNVKSINDEQPLIVNSPNEVQVDLHDEDNNETESLLEYKANKDKNKKKFPTCWDCLGGCASICICCVQYAPFICCFSYIIGGVILCFVAWYTLAAFASEIDTLMVSILKTFAIAIETLIVGLVGTLVDLVKKAINSIGTSVTSVV